MATALDLPLELASPLSLLTSSAAASALANESIRTSGSGGAAVASGSGGGGNFGDKVGGEALLAVGLAIAIAGVLLDSATLHVLRVTRFAGRPTVKMTLASLCAANLFQASATVLVLGTALAEPSSRDAARRLGCARHLIDQLWVCAVHCNLFTLVVMALEQFVCVRWPLSCDRWLTARALGAAVAASWVASFAVGLVAPAVAVASAAQHRAVDAWPQKGTTRYCYQYIVYNARTPAGYTHDFGQRDIERALVTCLSAAAAIALAVLVLTYGYIFCTVRRLVHLRWQRRAPAAAAAAAESKMDGRRRDSDRFGGERRAIIATFFVTVTFLAYYLPLLVYNVAAVYDALPSESNQYLYPGLFALTSLTAVTDPLIYSWRLKEMRAGLSRIVRQCRRRGSLALGGARRNPLLPPRTHLSVLSPLPGQTDAPPPSK